MGESIRVTMSRDGLTAASTVFDDYKAAMADRPAARDMLTATLLQLYTNAQGDTTHATVTKDAAADLVMLLIGTAEELRKLEADRTGRSAEALAYTRGIVTRDAAVVRGQLIDQAAPSEPAAKRRGWFSRGR